MSGLVISASVIRIAPKAGLYRPAMPHAGTHVLRAPSPVHRSSGLHIAFAKKKKGGKKGGDSDGGAADAVEETRKKAATSNDDDDGSPVSAASVESDTKGRMEKSLESLKRSLSTISTGRANPNMLDRITVDYYGAPTPLNQMASITTPEASLLVIQPFDLTAIPDIERAILGSDVDITPSNDGKVIRLNVPQLTADRRKEMTKVASKMGEEGKVAIRNVRRDMLKKVEKLADELGEDGKKDLEDKVQKLTDSYIGLVDGQVKDKNGELTKV